MCIRDRAGAAELLTLPRPADVAKKNRAEHGMTRSNLRASHPERVAGNGSRAIRMHGVRSAEIPESLQGNVAHGIAGGTGDSQLSGLAETVRHIELGHPTRVVVAPTRRLDARVTRHDKAARVESPRVGDATRRAADPTLVRDDVRVER